MSGVKVFLPLDDDSKCKSDSKAVRGQIKLDVLAEEAKYGGVYVKISHIFNAVQSFDSVFFPIQDELCVVIYRASLHREPSPFSFSF